MSGFGAINPAIWLFLALLIVSGILMSKNRWWGCFSGVIVGFALIWMGTQDTGQLISEMPIGVAICIYYLICGFIVYKKQ